MSEKDRVTSSTALVGFFFWTTSIRVYGHVGRLLRGSVDSNALECFYENLLGPTKPSKVIITFSITSFPLFWYFSAFVLIFKLCTPYFKRTKSLKMVEFLRYYFMKTKCIHCYCMIDFNITNNKAFFIMYPSV